MGLNDSIHSQGHLNGGVHIVRGCILMVGSIVRGGFEWWVHSQGVGLNGGSI